MGDEEEVPEPKRKVFIQAVSGYIGGNLAKRFAADGFEVLGTLKAPSDPKPLAVTTVVEATPSALATAFRASELIVLDCLGDCEAAEKLLDAVKDEAIESAKVLVGVSSVMTWARTSPSPDEPETPLTESEYKRRRPHSKYKELVDLEKMVTKSAREGLRTHVVAAGLTYGNEEDLFHSLFKAAWGCQPLPLLSMSTGANVRAAAAQWPPSRAALAPCPRSLLPPPLALNEMLTRGCLPISARRWCLRSTSMTCAAPSSSCSIASRSPTYSLSTRLLRRRRLRRRSPTLWRPSAPSSAWARCFRPRRGTR